MSKKNKKLKEHYTTKRASSVELKNREEIIQKFLKSPVPKNEILENLGLFLTTKNFETQFGREVVFHNELILNTEFKDKVEKLQNENKNLNVWQWQHYTFEEGVIKSMKVAKEGMINFKKKYQKSYKEFQLKII